MNASKLRSIIGVALGSSLKSDGCLKQNGTKAAKQIGAGYSTEFWAEPIE
jgi:hypothetical protein